MEAGQAQQAPVQQPLNPVDLVSAALEADAPRFEKAQKEAQFPSDKRPDDEPDKEPAKESEQKPEEQEEQQEEQEISLDFDAPLIETKYKIEGGDDKVEKLSIKQLQDGFMRHEDYKRKTAELARQRESVAKEVESQTMPALENYSKQLQATRAAVFQMLAPELQGVDMVRLATENPAEYVAKQARFQQVSGYLNNINQQIAQAEQAKAQQATLQKQKAIQSAIETLQNDIPDWSPQKYQELMKQGVEMGYAPQEVAEIYDPRLIKLLDIAKRFNALQSSKPEIDKKVAKVPKVLKPGTADKDTKADHAKEKWARLDKTKSREAAASIIADFL